MHVLHWHIATTSHVYYHIDTREDVIVYHSKEGYILKCACRESVCVCFIA